MLRKLGRIELHLDKIKPILHTFTSGSGFVTEEWRSGQQQAFRTLGMSVEQISSWLAYPEEVGEICNHYSTDVFKRFIEKLLGPEFYTQNNCEPNIVMWRIQEQKPGRITIPHVDLYTSVKKNHNIEKDQLLRLWIPLEDAKFGHLLLVGEETLDNFKSGEIYDWDNEMHTGINAGFDPRYTLLVYLKKNT